MHDYYIIQLPPSTILSLILAMQNVDTKELQGMTYSGSLWFSGEHDSLGSQRCGLCFCKGSLVGDTMATVTISFLFTWYVQDSPDS